MTDRYSNCGVLFDLDGVLIDSESAYTEFWRDIDRRYPTGVDDFAIAIKGTTLPSIMKYFPDRNVQDDIVSRLYDFQRHMSYPIYPGVIEFLQQLKDCGIPAAIVTSSDDGKMRDLFAMHPGFRDYFAAVIDASQVSRSKPDPEGYLKAASAIGRNPADCFVFEDSLQGLAAGNAAGATVIGLATTYPADTLAGRAALIISGFGNFTVDRMMALK